MNNNIITVGWCEWVSLPELNLPPIKAKVDTGAKTSCLHAFIVEPYLENDIEWVRFGMHPHQDDDKTEVYCNAKVEDKRDVTDSGGHRELRYVIKTPIILAKQQWNIEMTLTNRDSMAFRMLLGRRAMHKRILVNPTESYLLGHVKKRRKIES